MSNSASNSVSVISAFTDRVLATIPVGDDPQGIAVNQFTGTVHVTDVNDNAVSVINGFTNAVTATVPVGFQPFRIALDQRNGKVIVANELSSTVSVINGSTNTGTTMKNSVPRISASSVKPPTAPATPPTSTPIMEAMTIAPSPTASAVGAP